MRSKKIIFFLLGGFCLILILIGLFFIIPSLRQTKKKSFADLISVTPFLSITPTLTPTPTPRPLTLTEMNERYGPCVYLSTLMYHHVEDLNMAKEKAYSNTISPEIFRKQMEYLRDQGYTTVKMIDLINFFDAGTPLPQKSILLTFDDGYRDFESKAYPILSEFGFRATVFLATGLMENPDYLSWAKIEEMARSGNILFANHTWSHKNVQAIKEVIEKEIGTADKQLADRGLNSPKVFAYPYGLVSSEAQRFLTSRGYSLAFTTNSGSILCQKQHLQLPRIRIGNSDLSYYGL